MAEKEEEEEEGEEKEEEDHDDAEEGGESRAPSPRPARAGAEEDDAGETTLPVAEENGSRCGGEGKPSKEMSGEAAGETASAGEMRLPPGRGVREFSRPEVEEEGGVLGASVPYGTRGDSSARAVPLRLEMRLAS